MPSVVEQTPYNEYTGNGVATAYPYEFELLDADDLVVTIDGVVIPASDFTLTGVGDQGGGTVTFDTAPGNLTDVLLSRDLALQREIDYQTNGDLQSPTVNLDFNRIWQALQGFWARITNSIRAPYPEQLDELPPAADRANTVLAFDADGQPTVMVPSSGTAADVLIQLARDDDFQFGAAQIGFGPSLVYASGTVGAQLRNFASTASASVGAGLIGYLRNIAGAVATTLYAWLQRREVDAEDFASIQAALNSGASVVNLTAAAYSISTALAIPAGVTLRGRGMAKTTITLTADVSAFTVTNVNDTKVEDLLVVVFATQTAPIYLLTASTVTVTRNTATRIQISSAALSFVGIQITAGGGYGAWTNHFHEWTFGGVGTLVKLGTTTAGSWVRENTFSKFRADDFLYGVDVLNTAGDGAGENVFGPWAAQTSARTLVCIRIPTSTIAENQQNSFHDCAFYDLQAAAVHFTIGTGVRDTSITGATGDPLTPARFSDNGLRTRFSMAPNYLTQLLASGRYQPIPTSATWASTGNTGTATTTQATSYLQLRTGATNPSVAFGFTEVFGGMNNSSLLSVDFGKKFILGFGLSRVTAGASVVGRVQIKNSSAAGPLAAVGLGIQINDLAMTGESYGSALGGVSLGNLTDGASTQIMIIHYPGVRTEWWLDGVYAAQQTDTTKIPSGTVGVRLIGILGNNSVTDAQMFITQPWMWADIT